MATQTTQVNAMTEWNKSFAFLAGGGLTFIIMAIFLSVIRGTSDGIIGFLMIVGIAGLITGVVMWSALSRPWTRYDDLSTPLYTGHAHHEEQAPHIADAVVDAKAIAPDTHSEISATEYATGSAHADDDAARNPAIADEFFAAISGRPNMSADSDTEKMGGNADIDTASSDQHPTQGEGDSEQRESDVSAAQVFTGLPITGGDKDERTFEQDNGASEANS